MKHYSLVIYRHGQEPLTYSVNGKFEVVTDPKQVYWTDEKDEAREIERKEGIPRENGNWYEKDGNMISWEVAHNCNGCQTISTDVEARRDYYGLATGNWCDKCYNDPNVYHYRKDAYFDPLYAGERMDDDY